LALVEGEVLVAFVKSSKTELLEKSAADDSV